MKAALKLSLAACCAAAVLFFSQRFLIPLAFRAKEPRFAMPIAVSAKPLSPGRLPVRNDAYGEGRFGARRKNGRRHTGIDLAAAIGTPVYASKSGWARSYHFYGGYGNLVIINHPGNWQTRYAHLDRIAIMESQWVWQGSVIGFVGKSGNANAEGITPHLHFEIRYKNKPINPADELTKEGGRR